MLDTVRYTMKIVVLLAIGVCSCVAGSDLYRGRPDWDDDWKSFKHTHGKKYGNAAEESVRRKHWERSRDIITKHNQEATEGKHSYRMSENHLCDMTDEELAALTGTRIPKDTVKHLREELAKDRQLPASVDWRTDSCLPAVKNQRSCGSCWAFAATTPLEFLHCKKSGVLRSFSEQQLVDCSRAYGNAGCSGGFYTNAWRYIPSGPGLTCTGYYPYTATNGTCKYNSATASCSIYGYAHIPNNELSLRTAVAEGPVSAVMQVVSTFNYYKDGVYTDATCPKDGSSINHAVVLVGYGDLNGKPYWILRNSWGINWGIQGYMLIARGENMCNIETSWNAKAVI